MKKFMYNMLVAMAAIVIYALIWEKVNYPSETAIEVISYVFEAENINAFVWMAVTISAMQTIVAKGRYSELLISFSINLSTRKYTKPAAMSVM